MKKRLLLLISTFILCFGLGNITVLAAQIDGFLVKIPKNITVNEAVDLEISAVKDGNIVPDYEGTVFIRIEGLSSSQSDITSNGVYPFTAGDQGKKLFSKGIKVMKAGTYTLVIEDVTDSSLNSKTTIVISDNKKQEIKMIDIISPVADGIENGENVDVLGSSIELPNTPIKIHLNGSIVSSVSTDSHGAFSSKITLQKTGENTLEVKAFDLNNNLIGKSNLVTFISKKEEKKSAIKSVSITPDTTVEKASKVTITLNTREDIEIAKILFGGEASYQMEKVAVGKFEKSFLAQKAGKIKVKFSVIENGVERTFDKDTVITVNEVQGQIFTGGNHASFTGDGNLFTGTTTKTTTNTIEEIIIVPKSVDGSEITISWKAAGNSKKFMVTYGLEKTTLEENIIVDDTSINVEKLDPESIYYFQIIPLNEVGDQDGDPSKIVEYSFLDNKTCVVENIQITTKEINGKNYLVWDAVENIDKYEIYRSDFATNKTTISDMNKVGETQDTKFEYPFDFDSKEEKYSYYAVQAVCKGGQKIQIGNVEKVKTGPLDNMLIILILSGLLFSMYKLHKVTH